MAREYIYKKAFQSLLDGKLTKQELWELITEHFNWLDSDNKKLQESLDEYRSKYEHLLKQVNEAHKEHERLFKP